MAEQPPRVQCVSCQHRRQRCRSECPFAPYLSAEVSLQNYGNLQNLYGFDNILGTLHNAQTPGHKTTSMNCMLAEAAARAADPVRGTSGYVVKLRREREQLKREILDAKAIADHAISGKGEGNDDVLDSETTVIQSRLSHGAGGVDRNLGLEAGEPIKWDVNADPIQVPFTDLSDSERSQAVVDIKIDPSQVKPGLAGDPKLLKFGILIKDGDQDSEGSSSRAESLGSSATGFDLNLPRSPPDSYGVYELDNDQDNAVTGDPENEGGDDVAGNNNGGQGSQAFS